VGEHGNLHELRLRIGSLHRLMQPRRFAVLRQQRTDLQRQRQLGRRRRVRELGMRQWHVHRLLRSRDSPVQRATTADLQLEWRLAEQRLGVLASDVHRGGVLGRLWPWRFAMQHPAAPDLQHERHLAECGRLLQPGLRGGRLQRRVRARTDPVRELGQR
jgi:hypothetical protein